jgi:hypothetical protein
VFVGSSQPKKQQNRRAVTLSFHCHKIAYRAITLAGDTGCPSGPSSRSRYVLANQAVA